jgi:type 1 fimbriae regulatory protein FimB/type 1 fimbriae regulatory protein FimE
LAFVKKKAIIFPVILTRRAFFVSDEIADSSTPNTENFTVKRRYLTEREVGQLMDTARKVTRRGHRDATMILVAYRHGLRASEVCGLEWHQIELDQGRLHVRRAKRGTPSVHPIRGDEIRALRRPRRGYALPRMASNATGGSARTTTAFAVGRHPPIAA